MATVTPTLPPDQPAQPLLPPMPPNVTAVPIPSPQPLQPTFVQPEPTPTKLGSQDPVPIGISASSLGLNGSLNPPLPVGIYIIAGLTLLNFLAVFFNTNSNPVYSIVMVIDLLLAVGLFSKLEIARKVTLYAQIISAILICIVIVELISLQAKANKDYAEFNQAIAHASTIAQTPEQKTEIAALEAKSQQLRKQVGHSVDIAYVRDGLSILVDIGVIFYLTRPGVKEAFHT